MSDGGVTWQSIGAWERVIVPVPAGAQRGVAGVIATPIEHCGIATVVAHHDTSRALAEYFISSHGVTLPARPAVGTGRNCMLVWGGPDQWLAVSRDRTWPAELAAELGGIAGVSDHSGGRALLHLSGVRMRDALAKGCPIDLHPRAFAAGDAALTIIAQVAVHLWRLSSDDGLHVAVSRSMAGSFWKWLHASAAEFGLEVASARPA